MALTLSLSSDVTVDESNLLQNFTQSTAASDVNDNDITVASIDNTSGGGLPFPFESRLFALGLGGTTPMQAALSGYTGAAGNTGADLLTISGGAYIDLAFTDASGAALDGDFSGLYTLDGTKIFLYTDTNNNIVLGRKGFNNGTTDPSDDTPLASGTIVFAAYLEETATGAKVWMVLREPLKHPDTSATINDPDDFVDMTNHLWVTATQDLSFDFSGVPSGQNLFLMFASPDGSAGIVVTGRSPADQSSGAAVNTGDTVNTSQGGGKTTIGTNNQMIDPPSSKDLDGEGMSFTFVTNPVANYTVPNLTHGEAVVENNIDFGGLLEVSRAMFSIAQLQPPKEATLKISAYKEGGGPLAFEDTSNYVNGLADDILVQIDNVKVYSDATKATTILDVSLAEVTVGTPYAEGGMTVTFYSDGTVEISGVQEKNAIEYHTGNGTTELLHNRVVIDNVGSADAKLNASFDIGGFFLPNIIPETREIGSALNFEDDGPRVAATKTWEVDEDGLTGASVGIGDAATGDLNANDGVNDDNDGSEVTASGVLTDIFNAGNDGLSTFGLHAASIPLLKAYAAEDLTTPLVLTSKGQAVQYDVQGDTLWAFVDGNGTTGYQTSTSDRAVFKLVLTNTNTTGNYTFTLLDQLDHPNLNNQAGDDTENDIVLQLGAILKISDKDGDFVTAPANALVITVDDDMPVLKFISNVVGYNTADPLIGVYSFPIGADDTGNGAADGIILLGLTGTTSGGRAIIPESVVLTHGPEDPNSVTYSFEFDYYTSSVGTATKTATGTVTFNKLTGTYVFDLDAPIDGSTTFSTSDILGLKTYDTGGANSPEITVREYTSDFVGVLYARTTDGGNGASNDMVAGSPSSAYDHTFVVGETFDSVQAAYINVSTDTLGADSDTLQPDEILNFDFFVDNPVAPASPSGTPDNPTPTPGAAINFATGKAFVDTVAITLNQININGQDDVAVVLKLYNAGTNTFTTKLLLANSATDYVAIAGTQNHVVTIGTDDYDYAGGYRIYGVQVLASTQNVLDGNLEAFSLSTGTAVSLSAGSGTYADSSDNDVLKIVKIDVTISTPADAQLQFTGKVVDADGDSTSNFVFDVILEGNSQVLTGTTGIDYLNGSSTADTLIGDAGADILVGGGDADIYQQGDGHGLAGTAAADLGVAGLTDGDTITFGNGVDVINGFLDDTDKLSLEELAINLADSSASFDVNAVNYGIADDDFAAIRGSYDAVTGVFTANALGADKLLGYDADALDGTVDVEFVVLVGAGGATITTADFV